MVDKSALYALGIVAVLFVVTGSIDIGNLSFLSAARPPASFEGFNCGVTTAPIIQFSARNYLDPTLYYRAAVVTYVDSTGSIIATETGTAGASKSPSTGDSIRCGTDVTAYILSSTTSASETASFTVTTSPQDFEMQVTNNTEVTLALYDSTLANETTDGTTGHYAQGATGSVAHAMGSGDSLDMIIKAKTVSTAAKFKDAYICANFNLARYSKLNGVTIEGLAEVDLPKYCADNAYEKAWKVGDVMSGKTYTYAVHILADVSAPGDDNVAFLWADSAWYQDADGSIKYGTIGSAASDLGAANDGVVTVDIS